MNQSDKDYEFLLKKLKDVKDSIDIENSLRYIREAAKNAKGIKRQLLFVISNVFRGLDNEVNRLHNISQNHLKKIAVERKRAEAIEFERKENERKRLSDSDADGKSTHSGKNFYKRT